MDLFQQLKSGQIDSSQAMALLQNSLKQTMPVMESINLAVGDSTGAFIPLHEAVNTTTFAMGNFQKAIDENRKTQQKQIDADPDATTSELVKAQKYLLSSASHLQATALSFDSVSGGLETVMEAVDNMTKVVYRRIGTIGDTQRPNTLQTQSDIDLRALQRQHAEKTSEKDALVTALDTMSKAPMHDKQRQELSNRIDKLTTEIKQLDSTIVNTYKTKSTEKPTLGRMFQHFSPSEHWTDVVNPFVTTPGSLKDRLEKESGMSATRVLTDDEIEKFRKVWNQGDGTLNDELWEQFKQIFEEMKQQNNEKTDQNTQAINEMGKKLDVIASVLNQGNKNTKEIQRHVQVG